MGYQYNNLLAHLVPTGTPRFLMPLIVVIETVRNVIRPATLAIRLAANGCRAFITNSPGGTGPLPGGGGPCWAIYWARITITTRSGCCMYSILRLHNFRLPILK